MDKQRKIVSEDMRHLPPDAGQEEVCRFFGLPEDACARLATYVAALERWNPHINLVAPSTLKQAWVRHVADALQLLPLVPDHVKQIVDLGSGSGVPGLVLALAVPERWDMHLVESVARKAAFMRQVAQRAGVDVNIHQRRIEQLDARALGADPHTLVTARALAPLPRLLELAGPLLEAGAMALLPKGRSAREELEASRRAGWRFTVEEFPSVTNLEAHILRVGEVGRD